MTAVIQGQTTYNVFPDVAQPGQLANLSYNEIRSYPAYEVIQPGRLCELASDGLSVQQVQDASTLAALANPLGFSVLITAREGSGSVGIGAYGEGGVAFAIGEMVPVLMRGSIYAEWKGTTQTAFGLPNVYHSSTIATDRGKLTDATPSNVTGSEVSPVGAFIQLRQTFAGTKGIALIDVNLPGKA